MDLPDWIKQYKEPHTDIRRIGNGFYKYEVAFGYSKAKISKKTANLSRFSSLFFLHLNRSKN